MITIQSTAYETPRAWKRVHGVNTGPVCYGGLIDVSDYYRALHVPYVRLHDTNWPHPREVDIHTIFPDFARDPADPTAYDFARTDVYLQSIIDTGAKIIYRLGESIEHTAQKFYIHPPADFAKWAEICVGIIRHYNQGWANGFHHDIEHWEIWNEPESLPTSTPETNAMWSGTQEQYFDLYRIAAQRIKQFDPTRKVGGPAYTGVHDSFLHKFLGFCRDQAAPLDFFSWHTYADKPLKIRDNAVYMHQTLGTYGFGEVEIHLNEWNYVRSEVGETVFGGNSLHNEAVFARSQNEEGASFIAAVLMLLQDLPVTIANFFVGAPTAFLSLFNQYGVPQKNYYAFQAFQHLIEHPVRLHVTLEPQQDHVVVAAGQSADGRESAVLCSNCSPEVQKCQLTLAQLASQDAAITNLLIDANHRFVENPELLFIHESRMHVQLPPFSVAFILVKT